MKIPHLAILTLGLGLYGAAAEAGPFSTEPGGDELVRVELVIEEGALTPGRAAHLGVVFRMERDWHIYWRNAGDTGLPPAVRLELPEGVSAGPIQWPVPTWYEHSGLLDFIYEDEVTLIVPLAVSPDFDQSAATIRASIDWLVCKEACLPGDVESSITVPVGDPRAPPQNADLFAATRARLPQSWDAATAAGITASWEGRRLVITAPNSRELHFFSYEPAPTPPVEARRDGKALGETLRIEYDGRIVGKPHVAGVLEVHRPDVTEFFTIEIPGPLR